MAEHDFTVIAVESFDDGRDKSMVAWCKVCGAVRITSAPDWTSPTYLIAGDLESLQGGSRWGRRAPPDCEERSPLADASVDHSTALPSGRR